MSVVKSNPDTSVDVGKLRGPGIRAFFNVASRWNLNEQEQVSLLGLTNPSILRNWQSGDLGGFGRDALERISYVLGIYKAINVLLPIPERADGWMRAPNKAPLFDGRSPLTTMTSGDAAALRAVRQYLDAQCN